MSLNSSLTGAGYTSLISDGSYTAKFWCTDSSGNVNNTKSIIFSVDTDIPDIIFNFPTPDNASFTKENSIRINVSITEPDLKEIKYNWNSTNFTMYGDSLILMYNFDNVSSLGENSTHIKDLSKYANNGTISNWSNNLISCVYGNCLKLNGSGAVTTSVPLGTNGTISFWVYWNGNSPNYLMDSTDSHRYLLYAVNQTAFGLYLDNTMIWDNPSNALLNLLQANTWTYISIVYNKNHPTKKEIIYKDGIEFASKNTAFTGSNPTNFYIGRRFSNTEYFNGSIDEVRIWNRSLSQEEIYQQYVSNLKKIYSDSWELYINQSKNSTKGLDDGVYTYFVSAKDNSTNEGISETKTTTVDTTGPIINLIYPENNSLNEGANTINFYYNVSDTNSLSNCSLIIENIINATINNPEKDQTNNVSLCLLNGNYNWNINCTDVANNINSSEIRTTILNYSILVDDILFDGNSTNLADRVNVSELMNIKNLTLEKIDYGKIIFLEEVDISHDIQGSVLNLSKNINLSFNRIEINSTALTGLNKSARLALYNLTFVEPQILKDNSICSDCIKENYTNNILVFTVAGFSVYSARETPIDTEIKGGSGGGGHSSSKRIIKYECVNDSSCNTKKGEVCLNNKCTKLFDMEILKFDSPVGLGEFFNFTYFVKAVAEINGDVEIDFWIEKQGEKITSGKDTIYMGSFEEKTKEKKLFLPSEVDSGTYEFFIQVKYGNYTASAHRTIEIEIDKGLAIITASDSKNKPVIILVILFMSLILIGLIVFGAKRYKKYKIKEEEKRIKEYLKGLDLYVRKEGSESIYDLCFKNERTTQKETTNDLEIKNNSGMENKGDIKNFNLDYNSKIILTLLNNTEKTGAIGFIKKYIVISDEEIRDIINKLHENGLIEVVKLNKGEIMTEKYFHTPRVKPEMLNDDIRFRKDKGWSYI